MEIRPIDANALIDKLEGINPVDYGAMSSYETHCGARDALSDAVRYVNDAPTLSLNTLRDEIYQDAVAHGLWLDTDGPLRCVSQIDGELRELSEEAGNILDVRSDGGDETEVWAAYCEELADVIITCFSAAGHLGIDIDAAIRRKMEINKERPWKHEGEKK